MKLLAALLAGTALSLPAVAYSVPPATTVVEQKVIADGHVDLGPRFVAGKWTIQLRDDTVEPAVWRPLEQVVLQASSKTAVAVPADPAYSFLGKAGQKVWVIPQVQQAGVVWPGWNTQDAEVAARVDREVTWTLEGVDGPGVFTLFLNSDFGKPAPVFDSRKPFPQRTGVDVDTHVHGNWTFDAAGTYLLDISMTAELTDGSTVTDRRTLRLYAGAGDARTAFSAGPKAATPQPSEAGSEPTAAAGSGEKAGDAPEGSTFPWIAGGASLLVILATSGVLVHRRRTAGR